MVKLASMGVEVKSMSSTVSPDVAERLRSTAQPSVYELAQELGASAKDVLDELYSMGVHVEGYSSRVSPEDAETLRSKVRQTRLGQASSQQQASDRSSQLGASHLRRPSLPGTRSAPSYGQLRPATHHDDRRVPYPESFMPVPKRLRVPVRNWLVNSSVREIDDLFETFDLLNVAGPTAQIVREGDTLMDMLSLSTGEMQARDGVSSTWCAS